MASRKDGQETFVRPLKNEVTRWLLEGDAAIRWQVLRDVLGSAKDKVDEDVLRALDYFQAVGAKHDPRLADAIALVEAKRRADGRWSLENTYRGKSFFELERRGNPSRWNTLRALRVLSWWSRRS